MPYAGRLSGNTLRLFMFLEDQGTTPFYGLKVCNVLLISSGSVYPLLERQEERGYLSSVWEAAAKSEPGGPCRRYYRATQATTELLREPKFRERLEQYRRKLDVPKAIAHPLYPQRLHYSSVGLRVFAVLRSATEPLTARQISDASGVIQGTVAGLLSRSVRDNYIRQSQGEAEAEYMIAPHGERYAKEIMAELRRLGF